MYIDQVKVSQSVIFFKEEFEKKFNLKEFYDHHKPCVFFGCYTEEDIQDILKLKNKSILIWGGSDALKLKKTETRLTRSHIKHIAISKNVYETLHNKGIKADILPVSCVPLIKNPQPKGDKIYFYGGRRSARKFYGGEIVDILKNRTNYEFIETYGGDYTSEEIKQIYKECFIGLRLPRHDGLSNTVIELGLMGRKCIQNSWIPTSLSYTNVNSIIKHLDLEYNNRKNIDLKTVDEVYNYINIGKNWLKI